MHSRDSTAFKHSLAAMLALYQVDTTEQLFDIWWEALKAYEIDNVCLAMSLHVKDPEAGMYRPMPAHVIKHLTETIPKAEAARRARLARERAELLAPLEERVRKALNDVSLGLKSEDDFKKVRDAARFEARAILAQPKFRELPQLTHV